MKHRLQTNGIGVAVRAVLLIAVLSAAGGGAALADTIETIKATQTVRLAYRDDAPPFSFQEPDKQEPAGYIVDLCRAVSSKLSEQLGTPSLKVVYVPVTAANRFDVIEKHEADLLCEATTATLARRQRVDFSIPTFVNGAGLLSRDKDLRNLAGLSGKKVGVLGGTTTEDRLRKLAGISVDVIPVKTHTEGLQMLENGSITAYFGDGAILTVLVKRSKARNDLHISDTYLSIETYALALAHGDDAFRLEVDTALSHIYRSGEIEQMFKQTFGDGLTPTSMFGILYMTASLSD